MGLVTGYAADWILMYRQTCPERKPPAMKLIIAIIQPSKLEAVKEALTEVEVFRLTVMDCQGFGRQKGHTEVYRGHEFTVNLLRKVQLQIAVNEEFVEPTINAIIKGGRTGEKGEIGDGKIFVLPAGGLHPHPHRRTRRKRSELPPRSALRARRPPGTDFCSRGIHRHRPMPRKYSRVRGSAIISMLTGSGDGVSRRRHHKDDQHGDPPFGDIRLGLDDPDPLEEQHHQRQLEGDAEAQRHEHDEAQPLADPRVRIDVHRPIEAEQEIEHVAEHKEERHGAAPQEQDELNGR